MENITKPGTDPFAVRIPMPIEQQKVFPTFGMVEVCDRAKFMGVLISWAKKNG
jgi:hypothetical protein